MQGEDTKINVVIDAKLEAAEKILKSYSHLQVTDLTQIPTPVPVLKINGEVISTQGAITTISGSSKSGKTAFSGILVAGTIAIREYDGFPDVEIEKANGKAVICLDSEQTRHKFQKNLKSILKRANLENCPENLLCYNIREEDISSYTKITSEITQAAFTKFNGIHMILVDGGADYIRDVNDPIQSNAMVKYLEDLAIKYSTSVITIVHVNPGSDKERGHFGSQLQRKSESVITVKTQGDVSYIEPKFLRNAGKGNIPMLQFAYDSNKGYHIHCGVRTMAQNGNDEKNTQRIEKLKSKTKEIFKLESFSYKEALHAIMKGLNIEERTAKERFKEMNAQAWIIKGDDNKWRKST